MHQDGTGARGDDVHAGESKFRVPDAIAELETCNCCFLDASQGAVLADNRRCRPPPYVNINRIMDDMRCVCTRKPINLIVISQQSFLILWLSGLM